MKTSTSTVLSITLGIIFLSAIAVFGVIKLFGASDTFNQEMITEENGVELSSVELTAQNTATEKAEQIANVYTKALETGNIDECANISEADKAQICRDQILSRIAREQESIEMCKKIASPAVRIDCIDTVALSRAIHQKNDLECAPISTQPKQLSCKEMVASLTLKCDSITDPMMKAACSQKKITQQNEQFMSQGKCDAVQGAQAQKDCMMAKTITQAATAGNVNGCATLTDIAAKTQCETKAYATQAILSSSSDTCLKITNQTEQTACITKVDNMLIREILAKKNISGCSQLKTPELKTLCTTSLSSTSPQ